MAALMIVNFLQALVAPVRDEKGQTMAEYGLLLAFIAVIVGVAVALLGTNLATFFTGIAGQF